MAVKSFRVLSARIISALFMFILLLTNSVSVYANSTTNLARNISPVLVQPTLIAPEGEAGVNPTYRWTAVEGAIDYAVFVGAEDESEPPKINDFYTVACDTECSFTPDVELTLNKTYGWWVAGRDAEELLGDASETKTFLTVPPPSPVVLLSPNSTTPQETVTPTYQWEFEEGVSEYRLYVQNVSAENMVDQWYDSSAICVDTTCEATPNTELPAGQYNWWVIAKNSIGESEPGDGESFEVLQQPPPAVTDLINPTELSSPTPEFSWSYVPDATHYRLVVINDGNGQTEIDHLYTSEELGCVGGAEICSIQWGEALTTGIYHWTVQTKNDSTLDINYGVGYGPPSDSEDFEIPPPPSKPTLISPSGDTSTATPDFKWDHQALANRYFVSIRKGTQTVFEDWYLITDSALSCGALICTLESPVNLDADFYTWSVQASGFGGTSPVSDELDFTVTQMSLKAVAISNEGELAEGHAYGPSISEDGQIVTFYSYASNIVSGCGDPAPNKDHDHPENYKTDIFVYDRSTNPPTITCVSRNDDGDIGDNSSLNPTVSSNGQYIVFASKATNFVWHESMQSWVGDPNEKQDIFVYDRNTNQTKIVSLAYHGGPSDSDSSIGMITPDGQFAVFTSSASYLVETDDTNGVNDVFLRDLTNETTELISKNFLNTNSGNAASEGHYISDDGGYIAYQSWASDLTSQTDENNTSDVFLWDNGNNFPVSVSYTSLGMGNKTSFGPFLPSNGAYVAFYTSANDIVSGCGDQSAEGETEKDIIIYYTDGATSSTCITSDTGTIALGASLDNSPSISRNGRILVFESENVLIEGDDNNKRDVFSYDLAEDSMRLISKTSDGTVGNNESSAPLVSAAGLSIVFESTATNLADGALYRNIYLTDLAGMINYGPPTNLSASDITSNQVKLSWNASIDAEFIEGYRVYQNNIAVATTPDIEILISDLSCETDYNFKVRAYSSSQESIPSNSVVITTDSCTSPFADMPADHDLYPYVKALYDAGYTSGCNSDPLMYCPDTIMDRGMAAVFMIRGQFGPEYYPPIATGILKDDWSLGYWAQSWSEAMYNEELSSGCSNNPLMYCPWAQLSRQEASVFGLRMMHGINYSPPPATGTLFADMTNTGSWATPWAEQAYRDGLLLECGWEDAKPLFCPEELVDRAWGAYLVVTAKGLLH